MSSWGSQIVGLTDKRAVPNNRQIKWLPIRNDNFWIWTKHQQRPQMFSFIFLGFWNALQCIVPPVFLWQLYLYFYAQFHLYFYGQSNQQWTCWAPEPKLWWLEVLRNQFPFKHNVLQVEAIEEDHKVFCIVYLDANRDAFERGCGPIHVNQCSET